MAKFLKRFVPMLWVFALCVSTLGLAVHAANDPVSATIKVNTAVSGDSPDTPETFVVEMTPDDASYPMPQGTEDGVYSMTLEGSASGKLQLSFDRVGEYSYTVRQQPGTDGDCIRDSGVYHITARVTTGPQGLQLSVVLTREGVEAKQAEILFQNRYGDPAQVTLDATVTLDNETPKTGQFSFTLKDEKGNVLQTAKNVGRDIDFGTISYDTPGTYTYTVVQVIGKDPDIIYDKSQYTVVVTVEKDDKGDCQTRMSCKLGDKEWEGKPHFNNRTKSDVPQTGDGSKLGLWIALLLISGGVLAALWYREKRREEPLLPVTDA